MHVTINGDPREIAENQTISDFLRSRDLQERMVVVERNGDIVPRDEYAATVLCAGDTLEIVQMMAGG
jgi:thiamine biosynthesis protein ThiS